MADLKSFTQPANTTLYTDVVDTERGFHAAHAKLEHTGYEGLPVGAINLDSPAGASRVLKQWNGSTFTGFNLQSEAYISGNYSLTLPSCGILSDVGSSHPGFIFDSGDFIDYNRSNNIFGVAIGNAYKFTVSNNGVLILRNTTMPDFSAGHLELRTSDGSAVSMGFHRAGFSACQLRHIASGLILSGGNQTDAANLAVTGRTLAGAVADDGVTALQTTSYSASNQPSLTDGRSNSATIGGNSGFFVFPVSTSTLKGGVVLASANTAIVAPVAGLYLLSASVIFAAGASGGSPYLRILKNGALYRFQGQTEVLGNNFNHLTASLTIQMLPNDSVSIECVNRTNNLSSAQIEHVSFVKIN